jgi:hypothetical protein
VDTVEDVARYDIRWLVLEPSDSVEAIEPIFVDDARPSWVGPAILRRDDVAVFPVCLAAADPRCAAAASRAALP